MRKFAPLWLFLAFLLPNEANSFVAPRMGKRKYSTTNFTTNTTINSGNVANYTFKDWVIKTGVTVTIDYDQQIRIGNLTLQGTAFLTHTLCVTTPCAVINLEINGDATIPSTATINANSKGYRGGYSAGSTSTTGYYSGNTTTGGSKLNAGGSHGGYGGYYSSAPANTPGTPYGSLLQPFTYGGGGGSASSGVYGGDGGGIIRLNISGTLSLEGTINAGGEDNGSAGSGAGAGGSIWVSANMIKSTQTGVVMTVWGGDDSGTGSSGGGGGRMAIYYNSLSGNMAIDDAHLRVDGGVGATGTNYGGSGTLYAKKTSDTYGTIIFMAPLAVGNYLETPFPQDANRTFANIYVLGGKVKMLSSAVTVTSSATYVDGVRSGILYVPTNGAAGYGSWFVPGTTTLPNGGAITEY